MDTLLILGILVLAGLGIFAGTYLVGGIAFVIGVLTMSGAIFVIYGVSNGKIKSNQGRPLILTLGILSIIFLAWDIVVRLINAIFNNIWYLIITGIIVIVFLFIYLNKKLSIKDKDLARWMFIVITIIATVWLTIDYLSPGLIPFSPGVSTYNVNLSVSISQSNVWPFWSGNLKITGLTDPIVTKSGFCATSLSIFDKQVGLQVKAINQDGSTVFNRFYNDEISSLALGKTTTNFDVVIPCLRPGNYKLEFRLYDSTNTVASTYYSSVSVG